MTASSGFVGFLNHWWNVPFLVMLVLVVVYFVLQMIGLAGHHDGDAHEAAHDADHDADSAWHGLLAFLGVGRVPFMVVWLTFFLFAGFTGLLVNRLVYLRSAGGAVPAWTFPLAVLAAIVVGVLGVRVFARLAARFVDVGGAGSTTRVGLVGRVGVVASAALDARFGEVRVHDGKDEILVHGRLQEGEASLARGARVVVIDYDPKAELYWVASSPDIDAAA